MRVPLPAATQWELVESGAEQYVAVHEEQIRSAAQDALAHNDDTTVKILNLTRGQRAAALGDDVKERRTGVFSSSILAFGAGGKSVRFFTGVRQAGENFDEALRGRSGELPPPIRRCDGAANEPKEAFARK